MIACKTVNEYHSNQSKLKRFYLEEQARRTVPTQPARGVTQNPVNQEPLGHLEVVKIAKANLKKQAKQAKTKPNPREKGKKSDITRATTFAQKSKEAALEQIQQQTNKS